ncbi:MAG: DUF4446 family protein [Actinomycetota bacterium]|nr:DUF4446 family protein [Actinomycetota bacterium]
MTELTEPAGLLAAGAAAFALVALVLALVAQARVRRLRAAQQVVLGASGKDDLVTHAASLQQAFAALHDRVEEIGAHMDERMQAAEERLAGAIAYRSLVRYDAYGELSGHQSATIALLDAHRDGVVLSCIAHRDTARLYCKQIAAGEGEQQLSPEEAEAVRLAIADEAASRTLT